jgi:hypothetical protein
VLHQGFYIVTYGLGIYLLNRLIGFLSPMVDPELEGPTLPSKSSDQEFKPFQRRLPEFKFWCAAPNAQTAVVVTCRPKRQAWPFVSRPGRTLYTVSKGSTAPVIQRGEFCSLAGH